MSNNVSGQGRHWLDEASQNLIQILILLQPTQRMGHIHKTKAIYAVQVIEQLVLVQHNCCKGQKQVLLTFTAYTLKRMRFFHTCSKRKQKCMLFFTRVINTITTCIKLSKPAHERNHVITCEFMVDDTQSVIMYM